MPSFSLVGALEFRDVVASLRRRSAASTLSAFESPVSPFVGGHYHSHPHSPQTNRRHSSYTSTAAHTDDTDSTGTGIDDDSDGRTRASEGDPWDAALTAGLHMHRVPPSSRSPARSPSPGGGGGGGEGEGDTEPNSPEADGRSPHMRPTLAVNPHIPLIATTPASPRSESSATDVANFYGSSTARRSRPR